MLSVSSHEPLYFLPLDLVDEIILQDKPSKQLELTTEIPINLSVTAAFILSSLNFFEPTVYVLASLNVISVTPSMPWLGFGIAISFSSQTLIG